jgi:hypothetical protein
MLRREVMEKVYAAFAGLEASSGTRTLAMYKIWVEKLSTKEYADELVVLACAAEFNVKLVCVPHTPGGGAEWQIFGYAPPHEDVPEDRTIYLGNNDVHYMWLASP